MVVMYVQWQELQSPDEWLFSFESAPPPVKKLYTVYTVPDSLSATDVSVSVCYGLAWPLSLRVLETETQPLRVTVRHYVDGRHAKPPRPDRRSISSQQLGRKASFFSLCNARPTSTQNFLSYVSNS